MFQLPLNSEQILQSACHENSEEAVTYSDGQSILFNAKDLILEI